MPPKLKKYERVRYGPSQSWGKGAHKRCQAGVFAMGAVVRIGSAEEALDGPVIAREDGLRRELVATVRAAV